MFHSQRSAKAVLQAGDKPEVTIGKIYMET
jgi:hypothetical protein